MGAIAKASQTQQITRGRGNDFKGLLDASWTRIASVMPKHMNPERMYQLALSTYNQTPQLAKCSPASVLSCLMKCSALGMEPSAVDGLGRAYILPFGNGKAADGKPQAQLILGYRGMIDLARRSGELTDISARAVHEGDVFEYEYGMEEKLRHVPSTEPIEGRPLTHVYMVAHFKDGGHYIDVMSKAEVDAIRRRSKASGSGPWVTDYEAMARKTVIRRAFPYLPVSVEALSAAAADETTPTVTDSEGEVLFPEVESMEARPVPEGVDPETGEVLGVAEPAPVVE